MNGVQSEDLQLRSSTDHRNQFERGQIDEFDVGTRKSLNGIDSIELWTDGKGFGGNWFPEYLQLTENKTGQLVCFPINQYLNEKNGGVENNPLQLTRAANDIPCNKSDENSSEENISDSHSETHTVVSQPNFALTTEQFNNTYSIMTKTGHTGFLGLGSAGTDA